MSYTKFKDTIQNDFAIFTSSPITITNTTTGTFTLMTWSRPNKSFVPTRIAFYLKSKGATSFTTSPVASIGTNATSYNNLVAGSSTTLNFDNTTSTVNGAGQFNSNIIPIGETSTGISPVTNGQSIILNITSAGASGVNFVIVFTIEGFCIPV